MARLGEMLVEAGLITKEQLEKALEASKNSSERLGYHLVNLKFIDEKKLLPFLSKQYSIPAVDLSEYEISKEVIELISADLAIKYQVVPINKMGRSLTVAIADPTDVFAIDDLRFRTGYDIDLVVSSEVAIREALEKYYEKSDSRYSQIQQEIMEETGGVEDIEVQLSSNATDVTEDEADAAPVIKLVNSMLADAVVKKASDIHVECFEKYMRVRFRIDGTLIEQPAPPKQMQNAIISRLKIMAELDISERRVPQDGRIKIKMKNKTVDFRVSTMPTVFGEKIVMRILDQGNLMLDLRMLGFEKKALDNLMTSISRPQGMVLVTGPTGSGKTTTLYSALSNINDITVNISTAEDPVEYNLEGINQVHVRPEVGMTFAAALKAFLRQDPDIILVGEIRDLETGAIGIKAAMTGHLVLSTLHTNDTAATINRMVDMGLEPFNIATAVILILAQRLLKRICSECRRPVKIPDEAFKSLGIDPAKMRGKTFYEGAGCKICNGKGYKGRQGIYEVMPVSPTIERLILEGALTPDLRAAAVKEGMLTLRMDALVKFAKGTTTIAQVIEKTM